LSDDLAVDRIDTSTGATEVVETKVRFSFSKLRHYLGLRRQISNALEKEPAVAILWASISPSVLGHYRDVATVLPLLKTQSPVYAVVHWGSFDKVFRSPLTALTARRMVRHMRGFVFLNEMLARKCSKWISPEQQIIIPNTIDGAVICTEKEVSAKRLAHRGRSALRLLFLSNMVPEKGYLDVLEAVRILHAKGNRVEATFAGKWASDADRREFQKRIKQYELVDSVAHLGAIVDRQVVKTAYLDADVFLLPSYFFEAQPLTIIEALNAGTPVITAHHSGIPELVQENKEAFFVPVRDPQAIASAVEKLCDQSTWQKMSTNARHRFVSRFSPETVRAQWLALLVRKDDVR
jgi:glycosyltransferase involved in cell wall biosynthesis